MSVASTRRVIAGYELCSKLGTGGMASVHLGRSLGPDGPRGLVAIKRLHEHLAHDPAFVNMLLQEAHITERIEHPNVVRTLDVVASEEELLLVMEYVPGETVARLLRAAAALKTRCSVEIAASVILDTLRGLDAAHRTTDEHGEPLHIVHRDVSPQNVIVGTNGVAKVLDFGIAKVIGTQVHTRTNELKGKIPYMAPEILDFASATPQADVWAAAVTLWEMLCAQRLFSGDSEASAWMAVTKRPIPTPGEILGAPTPLDEIVMRGLARDPSKRYGTAAEMADAIEQAVVRAPADDVAGWVASLADTELAARREMVTAVEHAPAAATPAAPETPTPTPAPTPARATGRAVWALVAVLAVTVVALLAWRAPSGVADAAASSSARASSELAAGSASASASTTSDGDPTASPAVLGPAASGSARPERAPQKRRPAPVRPRARQPDPCDPPYVVDPAGRKIFKLDCVR